jgi:hypothetical protein
MTNLLILYPDIPEKARSYKTYTDDTAEDPNESSLYMHNYMHRNTLRGERYQFWRSAYTTAEHNAVYDLGTEDGTDVTKSADFLVLSRADCLLSTNININLQNSSDDVTYSTVATIPNDGTLAKVGAWGNDYVKVFATTTSRRYWRVNYVDSGAAAFQLQAGKIYFGTAFDLGVDPTSYTINRVTQGDASFITSGGVKYSGRVKHPTYEIEINWRKVTDAKLASFMTEIASKRYHTPVFLHTTSFNDVLDGNSLIHCKIDSIQTKQLYTNWNEIKATFTEIHG